MNAVDGANNPAEMRSTDPTDEKHKMQGFKSVGSGAKISLSACSSYNTFNVQRIFTSARMHRAFMASAIADVA